MCRWPIELHSCGHKGTVGDIWSCEPPAGSGIACTGEIEVPEPIPSKLGKRILKRKEKAQLKKALQKQPQKIEISRREVIIPDNVQYLNYD
ncbi:hypothetical protein HYALB_00003888 [Hymenoscyphus albidus]|uniref:Uncharacterized protein n=1 Tax=Hymenoscyphus albidus TaxID=595503 RepID=A0A9N9LU69_9HELO|nr:hypothetical protein HYALB_00003888 [Hymenoscyphus albidus]